jgi:hypothetical protein
MLIIPTLNNLPDSQEDKPTPGPQIVRIATVVVRLSLKFDLGQARWVPFKATTDCDGLRDLWTFLQRGRIHYQ